MSEIPLIRVKNVNKSFGGKHVLKNVSFEVFKRELFVIVGYSGSGKSTLLRVLAGLEPLDTGEIYFGEKEVSRTPPQNRKIGMVFQDYAVWPHMTVRKNIEFVLGNDGMTSEDKKKFITDLLEKVGLSEKIDSTPSQLSGGQLQRVALARALAVQPDILLMDEPLSNLDRQVKKVLQLEILRITKELNVTTIFVTHDQEEAQLLADRIAVMNEGVIEQIGDQKTFYENPVNLTVASFMDEVISFDGTVKSLDGDSPIVEVDGSMVKLLPINKAEVKSGSRCKVSVRVSDLLLDDNGWIKGSVISDKFYSGKKHLIISLSADLSVNLEVDQSVELSFGTEVRLCPRDGKVMLHPVF